MLNLNTTNKTVIFGGSFDPVTTAHIDIVEHLSERFDKVIVMPCKVSPFKTHTGATAEQRLEMLSVSLRDLPNTEISTFETDSEGTNYTYLTLEAFARENLYFAIGSEMVAELDKWKRTDIIGELATLYVIPRPSYPLDTESTDKLRRVTGGRYEIADFVGKDGSSSEVRISVAMNRPEMFLIGDVADFISKNGLYGEYKYVNGIYSTFGMKQSRIDHSFSAALCGVRLAKRACVDTAKAATALLLHDIGKYVTKEQAEDMGIKFDGRIDGMPLSVRHAEIGAEILVQLLGMTDRDITEAVRWHTTGKPGMTPLEKIVYLADYIEPLRDFDGVERLRAETEKSIDDGLRAALENSVGYIKDGIYKATVDAYEYYCEKEKK